MTEPENALQAIRDLLDEGDVRADVALYNEATQRVKEQRYDDARNALSLLLALFPDDGQAWLLRAKVEVARARWQDALDALESAKAAGVQPPPGLEASIADRLAEAEAASTPAPAPAMPAPDIDALKTQLRHARSQNQILVAENRKLHRDASTWAALAMVISVVTVGLAAVQVQMVRAASADVVITDAVDDAGDPAPVVVRPEAQDATPSTETSSTDTTPAAGAPNATTPDTPPATDAGVRDPGQAAVAARTLAEANADHGGQVRVTVRGRTATLSGKAADHAMIKRASDALLRLDDIDNVDVAGLTNLARRDGTTYTVQPGDSLSIIAYKHYGDQSLSRVILDGNPQLGGRPDLQIDQRLTIPPVRD